MADAIEHSNTTSNVTSQTFDECNKYSKAGTISLGILLSLISVVTIIGNILVIASFIRERSLRSFGNYFIVNLSIADLIIGVLMAIYIPYFLTGCWELSRAGCIFFNVMDYAVPLASTWNIALISLDRYWSVCWAIQYRIRMTTKKALMLMTLPWIIGFLFYGPSVIGWEHWVGEQKVPEDECFVEFYDNVPYLLALSVVEFILPFVLVLTINILIYWNIRHRLRGFRRGNPGNPQANQSAAAAKNNLSRDRKTARSLAILVGVFLLAWAPYEFCALVNPICDFCIPGIWFDIVFWLLWLNSTVNPLLYALLQVKFRDSFIKILTCGKRGARPTVVKPLKVIATGESTT